MFNGKKRSRLQTREAEAILPRLHQGTQDPEQRFVPSQTADPGAGQRRRCHVLRGGEGAEETWLPVKISTARERERGSGEGDHATQCLLESN